MIGFMSGNQQDPDIMCEVFILAPTDLVDVSPGPKTRASGSPRPVRILFPTSTVTARLAHERRAAGSD